jgi:hypothetical protein
MPGFMALLLSGAADPDRQHEGARIAPAWPWLQGHFSQQVAAGVLWQQFAQHGAEYARAVLSIPNTLESAQATAAW